MNEVVPSYTQKSFSCPHCNAIAHQNWFKVGVQRYNKDDTPVRYRDDLEEWLKSKEGLEIGVDGANELLAIFKNQQSGKIFNDGHLSRDSHRQLGNLHISRCFSCNEYALWLNYSIVWPEQNIVFEPKEDMPADVKSIYNEASSLFSKSPRASAALLRLAIECLCNSLNGQEKSINTGIAMLVKKGMNERVQKALDIVRVTGNDAVHPGQININDNPEIAARLFRLVNVIVEELISLPAEIDAIYDELPEPKKAAVEKRDKK